MESQASDLPLRPGGHMARAFAVLLVAVPTAMFLVAAPRFGGYDSYYFLLYANDLAQSPSETSPARYFYFPGAYEFWRGVAMMAGRHFTAYQFVFAGIAVANAALTALIVRQAGAGALLAAAGYCGYFAFARRLELGIMTTEPLVTLAALLGVLAWLVCARRGRDRLGYLFLGAGYGLAVYCKQQGAFLALGAVGLLPVLWGRGRRALREGALDGATVIATALGVFAIGMALDGGGLAAVKTGVAAATAYRDEGQFAMHLAHLAWRAPLLVAGFAVAACLWPVAFAIERRRPTSDRWWQVCVWGLGAATTVATLFQYTKRGYAHYALLTVPFALIAILPAVQWILERARPSIVLPLVVISALVGAEALVLPPEVGLPRHELFTDACERIRPGQRLLLLPSRENALHWACGTHARGTRWGYAFNFQERPEEYIEELAKPELTQVFVFNSDTPQSYEQQIARQHDWSSFFAALELQGFEPVTRNGVGVLYRRDAPDR